MNTYKLFKDVIKAGNFKLEDMNTKIKRSYITNDITEDEQNELLSLASKNINLEAERPEWLKAAQTLLAEIESLKSRISALEKNDTTTPDNNTETPQYETWRAWDGISDKYQFGAIVEHNGILYESTFNGQNVWEPGTVGTEALWKVYEVTE